MTKIQNFINAGGTYNDNSESVITISPEGTKVEQHLHPQEKPVASDNSIGVIEERLLYGYGQGHQQRLVELRQRPVSLYI